MLISGIIILYCIIAVILTQQKLNLAENSEILETKEIEFDVNIKENSGPGFNLDKDKMHFGRLDKHTSSKRDFNLTNSYEKNMQIDFFIAGYDNISLGKNLMITPSSTETLLQGETKEFAAVFHSLNLTDGLYEGKIIIEYS